MSQDLTIKQPMRAREALLLPVGAGAVAAGLAVHLAAYFIVPLVLVGLIVTVLGLIMTMLYGCDKVGRRRWRTLVPSLAHGPKDPTGGFVVYVPEKEVVADADGGQVRFIGTPYEWGWPTDSAETGCWSKATWLQPFSVGAVQSQWPASAPLDEVAEAWFDFCAAVESHNRELAEAFVHKQLEAAERQALVQDNESTARELAAVLPTPTRS